MSDPIRLGIVGAGSHMVENLLPALPTASVSIVGLVSRRQKEGQAVARQWRIPVVVPSIEDLIAQGVEAVLVATTPEHHEHVLSLCIPKGVHVFVEKPPARGTKELSQLVALSARYPSTQVFVGYNFRFADGYRELKKVAGGLPRFMHVRFLSSKPRAPWLGYETLEASYLYGVAIHAFELILSELGLQPRIQVLHTRISDSVFATSVNFAFPSGAGATLDLGNYSPLFEPSYEIVTEAGDWVALEAQTHVRVMRHVGLKSPFPHFKGKDQLTYSLPSSRGGYGRAGYSNALLSFLTSVSESLPSESPLSGSESVYAVIETVRTHMSTEHK